MVVKSEQKRGRGVSTTDVYYIVLTAADEKVNLGTNILLLILPVKWI